MLKTLSMQVGGKAGQWARKSGVGLGRTWGRVAVCVRSPSAFGPGLCFFSPTLGTPAPATLGSSASPPRKPARWLAIRDYHVEVTGWFPLPDDFFLPFYIRIFCVLTRRANSCEVLGTPGGRLLNFSAPPHIARPGDHVCRRSRASP